MRPATSARQSHKTKLPATGTPGRLKQFDKPKAFAKHEETDRLLQLGDAKVVEEASEGRQGRVLWMLNPGMRALLPTSRVRQVGSLLHSVP